MPGGVCYLRAEERVSVERQGTTLDAAPRYPSRGAVDKSVDLFRPVLLPSLSGSTLDPLPDFWLPGQARMSSSVRQVPARRAPFISQLSSPRSTPRR